MRAKLPEATLKELDETLVDTTWTLEEAAIKVLGRKLTADEESQWEEATELFRCGECGIWQPESDASDDDPDYCESCYDYPDDEDDDLDDEDSDMDDNEGEESTADRTEGEQE